MRKLIIVIVWLMGASIVSAHSSIPAGQGEEAVLGAGYNKDTQKFVGKCSNSLKPVLW